MNALHSTLHCSMYREKVCELDNHEFWATSCLLSAKFSEAVHSNAPGSFFFSADCQKVAHQHTACKLYGQQLASYPGPAQLSVACSTEKRGEPGIFSHVSMTQSENGDNLPN